MTSDYRIAVNLRKLESRLKLFYFLRDLGIESAGPTSIQAFLEYMEAVSEVAIANQIGSDC